MWDGNYNSACSTLFGVRWERGAVCGRDNEDMMAIWSGVYVHMRSGMMSGRVCCGMVRGEEEETGRRGDESKNEEID